MKPVMGAIPDLCPILCLMTKEKMRKRFRPESLKALEKGEVLLEQLEPAGGSGVAVRASGVIEAPPGRVWPVLRDCEHYREFLPGVRESELKSRVNGVAVCATEIDLPFPLGDLRSEMRVSETEIDGGFRRSWTLIEGNYQRNQGSWTLLPFNGSAERTLAVYQLGAEVSREVRKDAS